MTPDPPTVSVVIPCRNERGYICGCIEALLHGNMPTFEIIAVDGCSTDGTAQAISLLAERDSRVRLLNNPGLTTPAALNLGISKAQGEFIAILGAHSQPATDWLQRNLMALEQNPHAVGVGGVLDTIGDSRTGRVGAAVLRSRFGVGNARFRIGGRAGIVDTIVFGCYRRSAFRYGLFDLDLATNQDDEFNTRLRAQGEQLFFNPSIRCRYYSRASWSGLVRQYWRYGRFKPAVFQKAGAVGSPRQLVPAAWVLFLALAASLGPAVPVLGFLSVAVCVVYLCLGLSAAFSSRGLEISERLLFVAVAASLHVAYGLGTWYGAFATFLQPDRFSSAAQTKR